MDQTCCFHFGPVLTAQKLINRHPQCLALNVIQRHVNSRERVGCKCIPKEKMLGLVRQEFNLQGIFTHKQWFQLRMNKGLGCLIKQAVMLARSEEHTSE